MKKFFDVDRIESLKTALNRYMKNSGLGWMLKHSEIVSIWNNAVGEEIAENTKVRGFRNGTLSVDVYSPALKSELEQFYKESIVETIKSSSPETQIRKIKFNLAEKSLEEKIDGGTERI